MEWNEANTLQDTDLKCKLGHQKNWSYEDTISLYKY